MRRSIRSAFAGLALAVSGSASAQAVSPRFPGSHFVPATRVRVVASDSVDVTGRPVGRTSELTGLVLSSTRDSVVMQVDDIVIPTAVPTSHITAVSESEGVHRHMLAGALIGGATGVGLAAVMIATSDTRCQGSSCPSGVTGVALDVAAQRMVGGLLVGMLGGLGAGIGTLIGAIPHEHWRDSSENRVGAAIVPARGGARVSVALSLRW